MTEKIIPKNEKIKIFWEERFYKKDRILVDEKVLLKSPLKEFFIDFCIKNGGWYTTGESKFCRDANRRDRNIKYIEVIRDGKFMCGSMEGSDGYTNKNGRFTKFHKWFLSREATMEDVLKWRKKYINNIFCGGGLGI